MYSKEEISIWFFIGLSLLGNGLLILGAGLYDWFLSSAPVHTVLYQVHASVWWGAVLLVFGLIYCIKFWPRKQSKGSQEAVNG